MAWGYQQRAQLLRSDPDLVPAQSAMMAYALPRGATIFSVNCASCHGDHGQGDRGFGVPDLTDRDWLYGAGRVSDIQQTVRYGIRSADARGRDLAYMPAYALPVPYDREKLLSLSPSDIHDVVAFLFQSEGRKADPASVARGHQIFDGRGGCWDCHGGDGRGDSEVGAPNLMDNIWLYGDGSSGDVFRSIADGHKGVCPAWAGKLSPAAILEVSLFVWSLSHSGAARS